MEDIFSRYDKEVADERNMDKSAKKQREKERFASRLTDASLYKTQVEVVQGAKTAFKTQYMSTNINM